MPQPDITEPLTIPITSSPRKRMSAAAVGIATTSASVYCQRHAIRLPTGDLHGIPALTLTAIGGVPAVTFLCYPFHEAFHWFGFLANGLRPRTLKWRVTSCSAPGSRLRAARYVPVLALPYVVLLPSAELLLRHADTILTGIALLTLLPLTAIKDTTRIVKIARSPHGLHWEDVEGHAIGWPVPNTDQEPPA